MRPHLHRALAAAALLAAAAPAASAQLGSYNPRPGDQGTFAIRNAHVVTVSGADIPGGTVVISGGRISAVGSNVQIPANAQVIDGTGLRVYPGMMDAGTTMGLSEIPQGAPPTVDVAEVGSFNPNAQAYYGLNPHSAHVGVTRVVGITHVISRPTGSMIAGQAALINLAGDTPPQMAVEPRIAMAMELPRSGFGGRGFAAFLMQQQGSTQDAQRTRQLQLDSLRTMLRDADAYGRAIAAYERDRTLPRPARDVVLAAMLPMLRGEMPVIFPADRPTDIREAVSFAREFNLKPVILGGRDAWQIAPWLREQNVPVILTGVMALPSREDDPYDVNYSAPARLAQAGVTFAIASGDGGSEARNLPYVAGMAAAFGLPKDEALKAVTIYPARIFGVGDRLGSIEVGKIANLVVTTGDMLEAHTLTRYLFIDGRPVPLDSKHEALYREFKDRP